MKGGLLKRNSRCLLLPCRGTGAILGAIAFLITLVLAAWRQASQAASLSPTGAAEDEIPPLKPPWEEIPPGFWEQHGTAVVVSAVLLLAAAAVLVAWWRRPRPVEIPPPESIARQELEPLRDKPETGMLLSRVSSALRHYVRDAFRLGAGEWTTTELARALEQSPEAGPELGPKVIDLLRRCDERKFAPAPQGPPLNAAAQALELIAATEARRAELARAAAATEGSKPATTP